MFTTRKGILLFTACFLASIQTSHASLFNVFFNNASDLGNAFAGRSVTAENAATVFTNPAGMALIDHPQLVGGVDVARLQARFSGSDTFFFPPATIIPSVGTTTSKPRIQPFPFIYYTAPTIFNCNLHFGLGITTLGGVGGVFSHHSVIRYTLRSQQIGILDLTPNVAYQVNPNLSVGAGLDIAYVFFKNTFNFPRPGGLPDASVKSSVHGSGYGWHAGVLFQAGPATRLGLTYHSQIDFKPSGQGEFVPTHGFIRPEIVSTRLRTGIRYASYTELGIKQKFNDCLTGLWSLGYNNWGRFHRIVVKNLPFISPVAGPTGININQETGFRNTWRLAGALNYRLTDCILLRGGVSYETPVTSKYHRTIPGFTKLAYLAVGAHYQKWKNVGFDAGILHTVFSESHLENFYGNTFLHGKTRNWRDTVGGQVVWDIA